MMLSLIEEHGKDVFYAFPSFSGDFPQEILPRFFLKDTPFPSILSNEM